MIAPSFRLKLLLAMMLLVIGVTVATLFVTQQRVQSTYQRLFQEQFETQVNFFFDRQEARLTILKEKSGKLAQSRRLGAALEAGTEKRSDLEIIYKTAEVELGLAGLRSQRASKNKDDDDGLPELPGPPLKDVFFRIVDGSGRLLRHPDSADVPVSSKARQRLERQLAFIGKEMERLEGQQIGYVSPELDKGKFELQEVIVTKIADSVSGQTLGALVLGYPMPDLGERTLKNMSKIRSGVWLDGQLHSQTIPDPIREELAGLVAHEIKDDEQTQTRDAFNLEILVTPHRVFYKRLNPNSPFPPAYQVCLYSLAQAQKTERELTWWILGFGGLAILAAFVLSLRMSHGLSVPLRELVAGTREIQRGNLQVEVPVRSRDEVGQLAVSFNQMVVGLALKEKYHNVLNMVADKQVAEELMNGSVALGGELREVTILFCDIRGFTALTQGMPPGEVIQLLNEHMTALTRVVYEHNGVVDKFVGDLLMAVFGAPKSYGNDAYHAARCALDMIAERHRLNEHAAHHIQVGIGIATGRVIAGCMGSKDRVDYTVLGERVNLASRLCGQAEPGKIVIDQTTREQLAEIITAEPMSPRKLKGFSDEVLAYELIELRALAVNA